MRTSPNTPALVVVASLALGLPWAGCSDEDELPPTALAGSSPAIGAVAGNPPGSVDVALDVEASHGGTVVAAGAYPVEVVPHASGEVHAYVHGEAPPAGAALTVDVPVRGRANARPVRLRWNARQGRYQGRVHRLEIVPGPIDVHYEYGGHVHHGHVATVVVAPAIEVVVDVHPGVEIEVVEPHYRVRHRKHKHRKHMRRKHRHRGHGGDIEIRF